MASNYGFQKYKPRRPTLTAKVIRGLFHVHVIAEDALKGADLTAAQRADTKRALEYLGKLRGWWHDKHPRRVKR